jgi:hypothetical protein
LGVHGRPLGREAQRDGPLARDLALGLDRAKAGEPPGTAFDRTDRRVSQSVEQASRQPVFPEWSRTCHRNASMLDDFS